ncbi:MAG: NAD-dependent epimerase/dehydratase family protein [Thermodesulfobacteriota bacterium]
MSKNILVTGGAGFIGSHLVDGLIKEGHKVTVLDALLPQVHPDRRVPEYLNDAAKFIKGSIGDRELLLELIQGHDIIFHEASVVGVGQSMYQIEEYVRENTYNTAILLDLLVNKEHDIEKLIIAGSMSSYGEGKYECSDCGVVYPSLRPIEQLKDKDWEVRCPCCNKPLKPLLTDEDKPLDSTSIYAITKKDQEDMCLLIGKTYGIPTVVLRYFNVYGTRQALSNPYTGVCAIFSCRIRNDNPPMIFEDGNQSRDFVHVSDIVQANLLVLKKSKADYEVYNVGTGTPISVNEVASVLIDYYGKKVKPEITNKFRKGDIRHCFADISKIKKLGYKPSVRFEEGVDELVEWVNLQPSCEVSDNFEKAGKELESRRLTV